MEGIRVEERERGEDERMETIKVMLGECEESSGRQAEGEREGDLEGRGGVREESRLEEGEEGKWGRDLREGEGKEWEGRRGMISGGNTMSRIIATHIVVVLPAPLCPRKAVICPS